MNLRLFLALSLLAVVLASPRIARSQSDRAADSSGGNNSNPDNDTWENDGTKEDDDNDGTKEDDDNDGTKEDDDNDGTKEDDENNEDSDLPRFPPKRKIARSIIPGIISGSGSSNDLVGLLQKVGNLLSNIRLNIGPIQRAAANHPNGSAILVGLSDLVDQVRGDLSSLINGSGLTNSEVAAKQGLLGNRINDIATLINSLSGGNLGTSWTSNNPGGFIGRLLDATVNATSRLLTGLWGVDSGRISPLLSQLLASSDSVLSSLVQTPQL